MYLMPAVNHTGMNTQTTGRESKIKKNIALLESQRDNTRLIMRHAAMRYRQTGDNWWLRHAISARDYALAFRDLATEEISAL